jgi:hypothetical protein
VWAVALAAGLGVVLVAVVLAVAADGGGDSSSSPGAAATQFVDAIAEGDRGAAEEVLCDGAVVSPGLDELLAGDPQVGLQGEITEDELVPQVDIAGTWRGEQAEGGLMANQRRAPGELSADPGAPWCVSTFTIGRPLG